MRLLAILIGSLVACLLSTCANPSSSTSLKPAPERVSEPLRDSKQLLGKWANCDKGYVEWMEFFPDGSVVFQTIRNPPLVGKWWLMDDGGVEFQPMPLFDRNPVPKETISITFEQGDMVINGDGPPRGGRFSRLK
jgi:hypothetical protein